jgi:type IV secretory pathway VirB10-like protein
VRCGLRSRDPLVLNLLAMKRPTIALCALLLTLVALSACARPDQSESPSNGNAPQAANNGATQPDSHVVPSSGAPLAVQTLPPPPKPTESAAKPADKPAAGPSAAGERVPKLIAPEQRLNFGKQPPDKNLVRAIRISNGGKSDLAIESVVPS